MSLYNMVNGMNPATFFILPMLGKHPDEYPRFRDCFVGSVALRVVGSEDTPEYNNCIMVYTRVGGDNRESYVDEVAEMQSDPNFVGDFDDDFDCTYATYVFNVPEKWKPDFDLIMVGKFAEVSEEYKSHLKTIFPKLVDTFDKIFTKEG